jgi:hypothetical protein
VNRSPDASGERASHQTWCGEGCVKSRRLVNSDVMSFFSQHTFAAIVLICSLTGCHAVPPSSNATSDPAISKTPAVPFALSIVPTASRSDSRIITVAATKPDEFYVVLTNISNTPQLVWEYWNSWGYQTISFQFILDKNQRIVVSKRPQDFSRNFPSTFMIPPGDHKVYAIRLDGEWDTSAIPKSSEMPVTLKAIYEVSQTPEASNYNVWIGRVESASYKLTLKQW